MDDYLTFEQALERDGRLVYTCKGVSMRPLLRQDRDVVLIEKTGQTPLRKLDVVLFRRAGGTGRSAYVLHRILRVNGDGTYWIVGDNCIVGETVAENRILGVLTAVKRGEKTIFATGKGYRIYSFLWGSCYPARFFLLRIRGFFLRYAGAAKRKLFGK